MYVPAALEEIEKRYLRDLWRTAVSDAVVEQRIDLASFGPVQAAIVAEEPEEPLLNVVLGAALPGAVEDGHLGDAVEWVESHGVDYRVPVTPGRPASELAERWLMERGHEQGQSWIKFARETSPPGFEEPPQIEVFELDYEPDACETISYLQDGSFIGDWWPGTFLFDLGLRGDWRRYVAYDEEDRSAGAVMLIQDGLAELGPVACTKEDEGDIGERQTALLRRCILDAAAAGCHTIFAETEAPESGERFSTSAENLLLAGFKQAFVRPDWRPPRSHVEEALKRRTWWVS